jgi:hypothetical protein
VRLPIVLLSNLVVLLTLATGAACGSAGAAVSPADTLLTIDFGPGSGQIDTTLCEYLAVWKNLVASYRVEDDESLWLLTSGGRPSLRHFRSVAGRAVLVARIDLPILPGGFDDFLFVGDDVVLAQSLVDMKEQAAFYRVSGDSIVQKVILSRGIGYNRVRNWGPGSAGRLRRMGVDLYGADARGSTCIRIGGDGKLVPRLEAADLLPGIPTTTGELVWADRLIVSHGISPVLDLTAGEPAQLEAVFDDGGFVIRRGDVKPGLRAREERFEIYDAEGRLSREVVTRAPDPARYSVAEGDVDFFTPGAVYQLAFDRKALRLIRY